MAKLDYYEGYLQVGDQNDTHYELRLRILFEEGDVLKDTIERVTDVLNVEGLRIAERGDIEKIDKAL